MHLYRAYGLGIASEFSLPELVGGADSTDVAVRAAQVDRERLSAAPAGVIAWATADDVCLRYDEAIFRITGGREILVEPTEGADERAVRLLLLGAALAVLLHQRGLLVLHASGVAIDGRAVVFLGEKGEGKSTLAAALHARGHPLLADDVVAIDPAADNAALAYPGFPQLKLWPESLEQLGDHADPFPRVHPAYEKRARRADEKFHTEALPLGRVYVLDSGEEFSIEPLPPQQRFIGLTRHSYLLPILEQTRTAADHFRQAVAVASRVPVLRLRRPRRLDEVMRVARRVEEDMQP